MQAVARILDGYCLRLTDNQVVLLDSQYISAINMTVAYAGTCPATLRAFVKQLRSVFRGECHELLFGDESPS